MNKCVFTYKNKEYSYDEFRGLLLNNYQELVDTSFLKGLSESIRAMAEEKRQKQGDVVSMGASLADVLDALASLIDKLGSVELAFKEILKSSDYKSLSDIEKQELNSLVEENTKQMGGEMTQQPSVVSAMGEKEETARTKKAKKASQKDAEDIISLVAKIGGDYNTTSMEQIQALADGYLREHFLPQAEIDFNTATEQLIAEVKQWSAIVEDEADARARAAFNQMVIRQAKSIAYANGQYEAFDILERYDQAKGGVAALTLAARAATPDPVDHLVPEQMREEMDRIGNQKAANSNRTKGQVEKELRSEANKMSKEVGEEVAESAEVDAAIETTVTAPPAPKAKKPAKAPANKKTEAKKRRDEALDKFKKTFSDSTRGIGPLMVLDPSNQERIKAFKDLVLAEIEVGYYTASEVAANIARDLKGIVSKRDVKNAVDTVWADYENIVESEKQATAIEAIKQALKSDSQDALTKAVAKALRIVSKDYMGKKSLRKGMTDEKILEQVLKDPDQTKALLALAYSKIEQDVNALGEYTNLIKITKPDSYTNDQWEAAKKAFILSRVRGIFDTFLGKAEATVSEMETQEEREHREKEKAKEQKQFIKNIVKEFYGKPHGFSSLTEALAARLPEMSPEQVMKLAETVEKEFAKRVETRDKRRITQLIDEITNKKDAASAQRAVIRAMTTNGALTRPNLMTQLGSFLGYKGLPQAVVRQVMAMMNVINGMPNGPLKQAKIKQVNTMVAKYGEHPLVMLYSSVFENQVRNILSGMKTLYRGGFSVFLLSVPYYGYRMITSPIKATRSTKVVLENVFQHRYQIRNAFREAFINNNIPYGRELPSDLNPYDAERPWLMAHNMKWKEVSEIWKQGQKGNAVAFSLAKLFTYANFQGKYLPITNWINGAQTFLDYVNVVVLRDIIAGIEAQTKAALEDSVKNDPTLFNETWKNMISAGKDKSMAAYNQARLEYDDLIAQGQQPPSNFIGRRTREIITENSNEEVMTKSHHEAVQAIGMGEPETMLGILLNNLTRLPSKGTQTAIEAAKKESNPIVQNTLLLTTLSADFMAKSFGLFARMGVVLAEKGARYAVPVGSTLINAFPFKYESKNGNILPSLKRDDKGNLLLKPREDMNQYVGRVVLSSITGVAIAMLLKSMFRDEPEKDEEGNILKDENGQPIIRRKYNPNALGVFVDFYGNREDLSPEQKIAQGGKVNSIVIGEDSYSFDLFPPFIQPFMRMMAERRDQQRVETSKLVADYSMRGNKISILPSSPEIFSDLDIISTMMANCYNNDFTPFAKVGEIANSKSPLNAVVDNLFVQTAKTSINPRIVSELTNAIQAQVGQYKSYVGMDLGLNGEEFSKYVADGLWFADPFIQDRDKFEVIDIFGNKVAFPPFHTSIIGMFGTSSNISAAQHINSHKDQYDLFRDDKGLYDEKMYESLSNKKITKYTVISNGERVDIEPDPEIKRLVHDDTYRQFGKFVNDNMDLLKSSDAEHRMAIMKYFLSLSKDMAMSKNIPNAYIPQKSDAQRVGDFNITTDNGFSAAEIQLLKNQGIQQ